MRYNELSPGSRTIVDKLVADYEERLPVDERNGFVKAEYVPAYVYNLFKGKHAFSYKQFKEIFNHFCYKMNEEL